MNLGEIGKDGQLKIMEIMENVNELYDIWKELKEDELVTDASQENVNKEENIIT